MFGFGENMIFEIPALLIALTIHEYAHAKVAVCLGDDTPRVMGRLTLNPIAHLDPLGLLMLWLFKFGWAKPVPINPNNFVNWRKGTLLVALAGPVSNIIMAFIAMALLQLKLFSGGLATVLSFTYVYNIFFAVFNLIPLPPLDGSKVLMNLLPGRQADMFGKIEPYAPFILIGLIYFNVINFFLRPFASHIDVIIKQIIMMFF